MTIDAYPYYQKFGVSEAVYRLSEQINQDLAEKYAELELISSKRQLEVLAAFQKHQFCEAELHGSTGYGYADSGRDKLEAVLADCFQAEAAFLRWQFASGTQVLYQMLRALLKAGDELLIVSGEVYDSLKPGVAALENMGINLRYVELSLAEEASFDYPAIAAALNEKTAAVYVQKSRGYSLRPSLTSAKIGELKKFLLEQGFTKPLLVDNCYGEFVELEEPTAFGADLIAGSLIKNPGGGIAPSGGYVAGREDLVERVAEAVTAPGLGREIGPSLGHLRELGIGLYLAPLIVKEALQTAAHLAGLFSKLGYQVEPLPCGVRGDIVQIIYLENAQRLEQFCCAIQAAAPIDHHFTPVASPMPGYDCDIIMASGSFTQGSSIELSADGPMREPYTAFFQGSFNFTTGRLAGMLAATAVGAKQIGEGLE
ncbi:MAG: methionine gamma-lyase family protein [Eubacteriales bacterium]|nr:methionine gamma-lyase family protein [Eubacteriales bacterium]